MYKPSLEVIPPEDGLRTRPSPSPTSHIHPVSLRSPISPTVFSTFMSSPLVDAGCKISQSRVLNTPAAEMRLSSTSQQQFTQTLHHMSTSLNHARQVIHAHHESVALKPLLPSQADAATSSEPQRPQPQPQQPPFSTSAAAYLAESHTRPQLSVGSPVSVSRLISTTVSDPFLAIAKPVAGNPLATHLPKSESPSKPDGGRGLIVGSRDVKWTDVRVKQTVRAQALLRDAETLGETEKLTRKLTGKSNKTKLSLSTDGGVEGGKVPRAHRRVHSTSMEQTPGKQRQYVQVSNALLPSPPSGGVEWADDGGLGQVLVSIIAQPWRAKESQTKVENRELRESVGGAEALNRKHAVRMKRQIAQLDHIVKDLSHEGRLSESHKPHAFARRKSVVATQQPCKSEIETAISTALEGGGIDPLHRVTCLREVLDVYVASAQNEVKYLLPKLVTPRKLLPSSTTITADTRVRVHPAQSSSPPKQRQRGDRHTHLKASPRTQGYEIMTRGRGLPRDSSKSGPGPYLMEPVHVVRDMIASYTAKQVPSIMEQIQLDRRTQAYLGLPGSEDAKPERASRSLVKMLSKDNLHTYRNDRLWHKSQQQLLNEDSDQKPARLRSLLSSSSLSQLPMNPPVPLTTNKLMREGPPMRVSSTVTPSKYTYDGAALFSSVSQRSLLDASDIQHTQHSQHTPLLQEKALELGLPMDSLLQDMATLVNTAKQRLRVKDKQVKHGSALRSLQQANQQRLDVAKERDQQIKQLQLVVDEDRMMMVRFNDEDDEIVPEDEWSDEDDGIIAIQRFGHQDEKEHSDPKPKPKSHPEGCVYPSVAETAVAPIIALEQVALPPEPVLLGRADDGLTVQSALSDYDAFRQKHVRMKNHLDSLVEQRTELARPMTFLGEPELPVSVPQLTHTNTLAHKSTTHTVQPRSLQPMHPAQTDVQEREHTPSLANYVRNLNLGMVIIDAAAQQRHKLGLPVYGNEVVEKEEPSASCTPSFKPEYLEKMKQSLMEIKEFNDE